MKYLIHVEWLKVENVQGVNRILWRQPLASFLFETATSQQLELLYELTDPRTAGLHGVLDGRKDGWYRILVEQQAHFARMRNKNVYKFIGHCVIKKTKDEVTVHQNYLQVGELNHFNFINEGRNIRDEVNRKSNTHLPGTVETKHNKEWKDIDPTSDRGTKYSTGQGVVI